MPWRRLGFIAAVTAALLLAHPGTVVLAQSAPGSVSTTLTVSVRVVCPCSVTTPSSSAAGQAGTVEVRCGRSVSSSSLQAGTGWLPLTGARPSAAVSTSLSAEQLTVSVDF